MAVNADKIGVCGRFDFWCQVVRVVRPSVYAAFQENRSYKRTVYAAFHEAGASRCAILARLERILESPSEIFLP